MNPLPTWLLAATFAAVVPAQTPDPAAALAKAHLLEQQEGDLAAAQQAYRALLDDAAASAVHAQAALRLGTLLWRLDQKDAAKPFLERAAAAGGEVGAAATAVLQGQGEDALLARERLVKAQAMVLRYGELLNAAYEAKGGLNADASTRLQGLRRDLLWLGNPAAQALIEGVNLCLSEDRERSGSGLPTRGRLRVALLELLWQVGERSAEEMLLRWSKASDVQFRREIAAGAASCRVAEKLVPVLVEYLKDEDPAGDVWISASKSIERLPMAQHVALLGDPDPRLQAAGLNALAAGDWDQAAQVRLATEHGEAIRKATYATDPRVASNAWRMLCRFATNGPREGTLLFLAEAERVPPGAFAGGTGLKVDGDDAWIHTLAAAAQRSGPFATTVSRLEHRGVIQDLFSKHNPAWTTAALDDICSLFERGYGGLRHIEWAQYFWSLADGPHRDRYLRTIAGDVLWPQSVLSLCQGTPLPTELLPTVCELAEPMLRRGAPRNDVPRAADEMQSVIPLVTSTRHPEAAAWLAAVVDKRPDMAGPCAIALITLSLGGAGEPAQAGLRKLLVWTGNEGNSITAEQRSHVFAELARVGDVAAIPLFPRAYEIGLASVEPRTAVERSATTIRFRVAGLGFLGLRNDREGLQPWHGYDDEHLVRAWRTLLSSAPAERICAEFDSWFDPDTGNRDFRGPRASEFTVPTPALPVLVEYLPRLWQVAGPVGRPNWNEFQSNVGRSFGSAPAAAFQPGTDLHAQLAKVLREAEPEYAQTLFMYLPREAARRFAAEAHGILRRTSYRAFFETMLSAGIELDAQEWSMVLGDESFYVHSRALEQVPVALASHVRPLIEKQISNPVESVQVAAITAMQRLYGQDAVGTLLPLLQHSTEKVRTAARTGLDTLKQEHEQRTYWNTASTGVDLRPASAAAKLLTQAKAGEPKEQRLLAIRSLAVLAAAESLPYLIDATKDQDPDIAAAARTAIAQIHAKSGTPEPAKK